MRKIIISDKLTGEDALKKKQDRERMAKIVNIMAEAVDKETGERVGIERAREEAEGLIKKISGRMKEIRERVNNPPLKTCHDLRRDEQVGILHAALSLFNISKKLRTGEISESALQKIKSRAEKIIEHNENLVLIFLLATGRYNSAREIAASLKKNRGDYPEAWKLFQKNKINLLQVVAT